MVTLDRIGYGVVNSILLNIYSFPIEDLADKSGYTWEEYKRLEEKYSTRDTENLDISDLPIIAKGIEVLTLELGDNDFVNLIQVEKKQALKLLSIINKVIELKNTTCAIRDDSWL